MANRKITYEVGFTGNTSQLQAALKQAVASLQELGTNPQNLQRGLEGAAHAALELNNHLRNAYNADTGKLDLTRFRQELDKSGQTLEDYARQLRTLGPAGEQAFMQVATAIGAAELPLKRSNQLLNQLWVTMKNTMRWRLTTGALNSFIGGLQQAFGYSKSLNASLNDIRIVTGKSADEMSRFAKEANQAAKELSTTTTTYTDASLIYYQQGLDSEAVKERTDATIKMANVTGQSAETISSQMTAVWNNFREGSRTLESYADTMVALGATTASSSKEIAEGLEKFAPIANSVGLSFDYASAALATLVATTRESASVAGNALKTLFSRLEGLKLGETLDDGTDLNKYSQALYTVGINIKDANGELKDMDLILSELGNRWKDLARDEQMALAQTVGGVRQYAQLVALMDNWQVFQQNLVTARTAEGSLDKQAQIYAESWEAARDRVKAATEDVYDSLINPKVFIDLDKLAQGILKPLASILDGIGGLTGLLPIAAALMTKVYSAQIANVMRDMAVNIGLMTGKEQERARAIQATFVAETEKLGIDYRDDEVLTQRLNILKAQVGLQGAINAEADKYSEYQMAQVKNASYMVDLLKQQALLQNDKVANAQQALIEQQDTLRFSIKFDKADINTVMQQIGELRTKIAREAFGVSSSKGAAEWGEAIKLRKLFEGSTTQVYTTVDKAFESVAERTVQIDALRNALGEINKESPEWQSRIEAMARKLGLLGEGATFSKEQLNKLREEVALDGKITAEADEDLRKLQDILSTLGADQSTIITYTARLRDLQRQRQLNELSEEKYQKAVSNLHEELKKGIKDQQDWASSFVAVANGASQAAVGIRAITNIYETFTDETLSASEKLTRSITSLTMLLPTATTLMKGFAAGASAAQAATSWTMVAVTAIVVIIKVLDALIVTQKEAAQSIQESIDRYKEAESELKSLQSELETTQSRIKELQDLAESGSISIVEQEELKNLQLENDKLERQIALKEKLEALRLREASTEILTKGTKAYSLTPEDQIAKTNAGIDNANTLITDIDKEKAGLIRVGLYDYDVFGNAVLKEQAQAISDLQERYNWFAEDAENYISYIQDYYNAIDEGETNFHENWKAQETEKYEALEAAYSTLVQSYKAGNISEKQLRDFLNLLQDARTKIYDVPGEYEKTFLDPLLAQLNNDDLEKLYQAGTSVGPVTPLSESGKDLALVYGVTEDELVNQLTKVIIEARKRIENIAPNLSDFIDQLSYVEINLIANANENFETFEQLLNYLKKTGGIIPVSIQAQTAIDAKTEALSKIASGDLLDDELIQKIQEAYQGIKDVSDIAALSVEDQIDLLRDDGSLLGKMIDDLQKREQQLQKQINEAEKSEEKFKDSAVIAFKAELSQVEDDLEKLRSQFERDPIKIKVETSLEIAAELNNLKKAIGLINDDLTVSAENLVELAKRYPEALVDAYYEEGQNVLKIEQSKYDGIKQLLEGDLDAHRDEQVKILNQEAQLAAATLAIVEAGESSKKEEYKDTLISQLVGNQESLTSIKDTTFKALKAVVQSEISKRQEQLETMSGGVASSKTVTDTLAKNAEITAENYSAAALNILNAFDAAFRGIGEGSAAAAEGKYASILGYAYDQPIQTKKGQTYETTYQDNLNNVRISKEYQTVQNEIKHLKWISEALDQFEKGDISFDTLTGFFDLLPETLEEAFSGVKNLASFDFTDTSEENINKLIDALTEFYETSPTAKSDLQAQLDEIVGAMQYLLESPEEDKTKGSGGKPDYAKLDNADLEKHEDLLEEIEDRYHEITREIERQNRILDQLETQAERTYGLDRLKLYEQELEELNGLYERQRAKQGRAERYLVDVDKPRLRAAFNAIETKEGAADILGTYGFSGFSNIAVNLDKPGQEIKDFEALEDNIRQDTENFLVSYRAFMVEYDNFLQRYNEATEEEKGNLQDKALQWQQDYELVKLQFELVEAQQEERLAAIKQYEETLDTINTLAHDMEETLRREEDTRLKEITHRMDVILDVRDARKQIRDFSKEIAESFGDALTHGAQTASLGWDQAKDEMAMYKEYVQEYNDLKNLLDNATEYTDTESIVAELRELEGNIIESGQRLLEWSEQVENMFVEALSAAADRFSYFTNQLEHNDTILSTIKELYALQGQTYKTQQGFNRLQRVAQERLETQVGQARLQRKWFEEADARLQEAQAQFDALLAEKGAEAEQDFRYDTLKKNRDALLKEQQEAQKQMLSYAQQAMETAQQMYLDQIEKAVYEFGQALSGGIGLDLLQDKYDHYIEEEERYLDKVNEAYQVAAWYDKLQKDIDNTSNKLTKDRLKALQEEIDIRREGNTLSQYDLDILEAKYKVLQAQMDLEDAQNAKSQLRLVRDSQGNWNYQFTTNPDDIAAKEQELLQAENEWYNIAKEQTKEVTGEIIATWQECQQAINEIYSDTSNFVMNEETGRLELTKEAQERETEIREFYANKVKFLEQEKEIAISDMTEAGNQAMIHMAIAAGETVSDITGITGKQIEGLIETTGVNSQQLLGASLVQIQNILDNRLAEMAENLGISTDELRDMLQRKSSGIESDIDSSFQAILDGADPATVDLYNLFAENWNLIGQLVGETSSGIQGNMTDTYGGIQRGLNDTGVALNVFDNVYAKDLSNMTKNTAIFENEFDKAVENMQNSFEDYGDTIADVADDCGVSLDALDDQINIVSDSTDRMIWEGFDAADALWQQVDATWDAQLGYLELAQAVWEYIYALQALAAEQVVPTIESASKVTTFDEPDEYDSATDWSIRMGEAAQAGDWEAVDTYAGYRERKFDEGGFDRSKAVSTEDLKDSLIDAYKEGNEDLKKDLEEVLTGDKYYRDVIPIASAATGMYTGDFDNGRLAILHEKELVLNAEDTKNILDAVAMVRTMQDNLFGSIAEQLDGEGLAAMALLGSRVGGIGAPAPASTDFEQHVTIESVSFPGVTSSREIEEAFESLVNDAAQWARRRKS